MRLKQKRIVFVSDLHTGSEVGIRANPQNKTQWKLLGLWSETIALFGDHPDVLVCVGDANDGQDPKGRECQENSIPWQIEEAEKLLLMWKPKRVEIIEGTAYHTGDVVAQEKFLAGYINRRGIPCQFHLKLRAKVSGWWKFQARHHIGGSVLPHGIFTSPARSQSGQALNAAIEARDDGKVPSWPHLSVFGHTHQYAFGESAQGAFIKLPAWQGVGSGYGDRKCDGHIDIGAVQVTVGATKEEGWTWERKIHTARLESRTVEM
jgi:hypothetical protein